MNKDFDLKNQPEYQPNGLRGRITDGIKRQRDDGVEMKLPFAKTLPIIPVTGAGSSDKFTNNKSIRKFE